MMIEGKGQVPPAPLLHKITDKEIRELYWLASENGAKYGRRRDRWGKGLLACADVPGVGRVDSHLLPMLLGLVGEYAVLWKLKTAVGGPIEWNCELSQFGDGGTDIEAYGIKMNAKCRSHDYGEILFRRVYMARLKPIDFDAIIGCEWDIRKNRNVVKLLGWLWIKDLYNCAFKKARIGDHFNLAIPNADLRNMQSLIQELRCRKDGKD